MARGEDEPEEIVAQIVVERRVQIERRLFVELAPQRRVLGLRELPMTHPIDGAILRRGHEPRAGLVGDARLRPSLERQHQRVLRQLLGEPHVAHDAREARDEPRRLDAEHGGDGVVSRGRHGRVNS